MASDESTSPTAPRAGSRPAIRLLVVLGLATVAGVLWYQFGDALTPEKLAPHEAALRQYRVEHPVLVFAAMFLIYVTVTGLSLPGAAGLSLLFAWFLGFSRAMVLISFASTAGATIAFLLSRYLLRDTIQNRFGSQLQQFNEALERDGAFYLLTLRLIPAVPFFVINVVMGLTPVRVSTFWWVSQLGMLPGTTVYVYAGSQFPDLQTLSEQGARGILTPGLLIALVALGLFPLVVKKILGRFRKPPAPSQ